MSDKTLVGKILQAVFDLFKSNWQSFAKKLFNKIPDDVVEKITIGIRIVQLFKKFIESPTADLVTAIIPGDLDDKIKEHLRKYLSTWETLKDYDLTFDAHKHTLASQINSELTGLSFGQSALTTEVVYQKLKSDGKLD